MILLKGQVLALLVVLSLTTTISAIDFGEGCWEFCLQNFNVDLSRYSDFYDDLLEAALEITYLKNAYNVSKVVYLIDSSISSHLNFENNVIDEKLNGKTIYRYELVLAMALAQIVNAPANYLIQYDEETAWTCDTFSCIGVSCDIISAINLQTDVEMTPTSHCPGNIEAACRLAQKQTMEVACNRAPTNANSMVVAITNGDIHLTTESEEKVKDRHCPPLRRNADSSSASDEIFSPCKEFFNTRYMIGTYSGSDKNLKRFPSFHGNYRYLHAEKFSYDALKNFVNCASLNGDPNLCCASITRPTVTNCKKTQGAWGEIVDVYTSHPALSSTYGLFGNPLSTLS